MMGQQPRLSRDEYRKAKELEELRKTGAAPPELDPEGNMINPHIPQYISQAPWYLDDQRPGLKHQKSSHFQTSSQASAKPVGIHEHYVRGARRPAAQTFRPGACTNCGSMTHSAKTCCERPRKKGAALTHTDIASDEVVQELHFDYDGKRDRWAGYNPAEYAKVIQRFEHTEMERKKRKLADLEEAFRAEQLREAEQRAEQASGGGTEESEDKKEKEGKEEKTLTTDARRLRDMKKASRLKRLLSRAQKASSHARPSGAEADTDSDLESDTDASDLSSEEDMKDLGEVIQKHDANARMTVRNLRMREDTAKYLRNLDPNSAYYDPKTRSMRENPYAPSDPQHAVWAAEHSKTGLARQAAQLQSFVWEANARGHEAVHAQAIPSQAEQLYKEYLNKKDMLKQQRAAAIREKYAAEAPVMPQPLVASEAYAEYGEDGRVIKGEEAPVPRTKYVEDVHEGGHQEIWGSWYDVSSHKWGYACCRNTIRHAVCTGVAGAEAAKMLLKHE